MSRRQMRARALDPEHLRLMLAYRHARGGDRLRRLRELQAYVTERLREAHQP